MLLYIYHYNFTRFSTKKQRLSARQNNIEQLNQISYLSLAWGKILLK